MKNRVSPHNLEVEASLISACLLDNKNLEFCENLDPQEFYSISNQIIWQAVLTMTAKKESVDLVTLAQHLNSTGQLAKIGGATYLAQIADDAPVALNCQEYASIISDLAIKRAAITLGQNIYDRAFTDEAGDLVDFAQSEALKLQQSDRGDNIVAVQDLVHQTLDQIEIDNTTRQPKSLALGFPGIDNVLNIVGPKLIIIAGRPSLGKTALAVTILRNLAVRLIPCGFLSIEMGREEIMHRWLSMQTGINSMRFGQYQGLKADEFAALTSVASDITNWPIWIDDTGSITISDVERKCRKLKKQGVKVIFIDQLSKIRGRSGDSFKDYTENCNRIANLKKELEMPVFLLAQINRTLEQRQDKRPTMSDLKMTGALEEDADVVMLIHRPEYYINPRNEHELAQKQAVKDNAEINIAKNRNGATFCDNNIKFEHRRGMFYQGD